MKCEEFSVVAANHEILFHTLWPLNGMRRPRYSPTSDSSNLAVTRISTVAIECSFPIVSFTRKKEKPPDLKGSLSINPRFNESVGVQLGTFFLRKSRSALRSLHMSNIAPAKRDAAALLGSTGADMSHTLVIAFAAYFCSFVLDLPTLESSFLLPPEQCSDRNLAPSLAFACSIYLQLLAGMDLPLY